jgi:uncharacterized protein (DUF2249 family)
MKDFLEILKEKNYQYEIIDEKIIVKSINDLDLRSVTSLPEGCTLSAGNDLDLRSVTKKLNMSYLQRFNVQKNENGFYLLNKKVSKDFKTQENTDNETLWEIGTILIHKKWNSDKSECGKGKFHACAKPFWCDSFRNEKGDRYIEIGVKEEDLFEWKYNPRFPQKIGFRSAIVIREVDRMGNAIKG